jgi:transposase
LRKVGRTQKEVSEVTGVAERSIRRIEREAPYGEQGFDDVAERKRRRIGRPSKVEPFMVRIEALLEEDPGLQSLEILRRLKEDGYAGGKSALFDAVAKMRPKSARPIARFEGLPGEFSQHDFGEVDVSFLDGRTERIHFFASRLKWSRWVQVAVVPDQTAESLVRALVAHFEAMGGVPLVAVFDRPKTIALEWEKDGRVTRWNTTFLQVMGELSVAPELCWPYQPQQKGAVENLVGWVKKSFFRCRRFVDETDLYQQLAAWHAEVNGERASRATGETPSARMQTAERARLRALKLSPAALWLRYPVSVGPDAKVVFDGRRYSMPPNAVGQSGTLFLGEERVRIIAGRWEATHRRLRGEDKESTLPEHRVAMVGAVKGPRAKLYLKRQHLQDLGPEAVHFLTELVHRRPQQWSAHVERLHEMLQLHGEAALLEALRRSNAAGVWGAEYVAHHLGERRLSTLVTDAEGVAQ